MNGVELRLNINQTDTAVFLSNFFGPIRASSPFHRHGYAEVHITRQGAAKFNMLKESVTVCAGEVSVIPSGTVHRMTIGSDTLHYSFLIDYPVEEFMHYYVGQQAIDDFVCEAKRFVNGDRHCALLQCIAFLCKDFMRQDICYTNIESREFRMREFFAVNYNKPVSLSDLAAELELSSKQTARLVKKYMGDSFETVLLQHRTEAARLLMQTDSTLTLSEIAQLVGYSSYSGFWKAMKGRLVSK
jgi:AraC-like DNA-binding protein/quercetin dioxygenase-like cupin family protein